MDGRTVNISYLSADNADLRYLLLELSWRERSENIGPKALGRGAEDGIVILRLAHHRRPLGAMLGGIKSGLARNRSLST